MLLWFSAKVGINYIWVGLAPLTTPKFNHRFIIGISLVSAMGGLLFGYDWVVIGGAKPFYERFFEITDLPVLQGWVMSCALIGCLAGAIISGMLADRYGRKRLLILAGFLFMISALGTGAANHLGWFIGYRILGGIGIGLASNLSPMYIAEVSPSDNRGKYVSLNQLTIVMGILAAQWINWIIAQPVPAQATDAEIAASWNGIMGWRMMFWAELIPASLFFGLMFLVPESPRWLMKRNQKDQVRQILTRIGGADYAQTEAEQIRLSYNQKADRIKLRDLFQPGIRSVLLIGVVLAVFQQWCGINVIFNYAEEIFSAAGYEVTDILLNIVITGSVNLVFTFVALYTVDKWGRRILMLVGAGGLAVIYFLIGLGYFSQLSGLPMLIGVVLAIACYAMTLAPVTWVVLSEIFPNRVRGAAMAIGTFSLWAACFLLTYTFPILNDWLNTSGTFWLYGAICLGGFLFIWKKLPETKGRSLEEIERRMVRREA